MEIHYLYNNRYSVVTRKELKDIKKNAGPDGYGSGFYIDVVGEDVINAVMEFMKSGKL